MNSEAQSSSDEAKLLKFLIFFGKILLRSSVCHNSSESEHYARHEPDTTGWFGNRDQQCAVLSAGFN